MLASASKWESGSDRFFSARQRLRMDPAHAAQAALRQLLRDDSSPQRPSPCRSSYWTCPMPGNARQDLHLAAAEPSAKLRVFLPTSVSG